MPSARVFACVFAMVTMTMACSSASDDGAAEQPPAPPDAPKVDTPPDVPAPAAKYPAFAAAYPSLVSVGGPVLDAPRFQLVTYAGDSLASTAESFVKTLPSSEYWRETTAEYGIGAPEIASTIVLDNPPATMTDADVAKWVGDNASGDGKTVYVFILPGSVSFTLDGIAACGAEYGGYHGEAALADGKAASYIVIPRCATYLGFKGADELTYALSHELVEVATDPFPDSKRAFGSVDPASFAFSVLFGNEAGDLCVGNAARSGSFAVARAWSNLAAAAHRDPCVPALASPYIAAIPVLPDTAPHDGAKLPVLHLPVGSTKTIDLELVSDGPTEDFHIAVIDLGQVLEARTPALSFSLDHASGKNGDVVKLKITATTQGQIRKATKLAGFVVVAKSATRMTMWPAFVTN